MSNDSMTNDSMTNGKSLGPGRFARKAAFASAILAGAAIASPAHADDLLGFYLGGAIGEAQVKADARGITAGNFSENHTAYKGLVGIRPLSVLGAELEYVNLGHPTGTISGQPADVTMKGVGGFGVLYLPLPVPDFDIYAKAGLAGLRSTVNGNVFIPGVGTCPTSNASCNVRAFNLDRHDSKFADGLGAQIKAGPWGVRAEYERFEADDQHPGLFSLGLSYTFF
jgi:hypothetical protein